jgi:hypothetical protein
MILYVLRMYMLIMVMFFIGTRPAIATTTCPTAYVPIAGPGFELCSHVSITELTWQEAHNYCANMGGILLSANLAASLNSGGNADIRGWVGAREQRIQSEVNFLENIRTFRFDFDEENVLDGVMCPVVMLHSVSHQSCSALQKAICTPVAISGTSPGRT